MYYIVHAEFNATLSQNEERDENVRKLKARLLIRVRPKLIVASPADRNSDFLERNPFPLRL